MEATRPLVEKEGVGRLSGQGIGAQAVVRKPVVGHLVVQVVAGIVVET